VIERGSLYDGLLLMDLFRLDNTQSGGIELIPSHYSGFVSDGSWMFLVLQEERVQAKIEFQLRPIFTPLPQHHHARGGDMLFDLDDVDGACCIDDNDDTADTRNNSTGERDMDAFITHCGGTVTGEVFELFEQSVQRNRLREIRVSITSSPTTHVSTTTALVNFYIRSGFTIKDIESNLVPCDDAAFSEVTLYFAREALSPRFCACREVMNTTPDLQRASSAPMAAHTSLTSDAQKQQQMLPPPPVPPPYQFVGTYYEPMRPNRPPPPLPLTPTSLINALNHGRR
jgi:hypothetical protein